MGWKFIQGVLLILLLAGCGSKEVASPLPTIVNKTAVSLTNTPLPPTNTPSFTPTTPSPTLTQAPSPTNTITPRPINTPIPTVTPANRIETDTNRSGISFDMEYISDKYPNIFESAHDMGIGWVRFRFNSRQIEPEMNQFEWDYFDTVVAKAKEEDLQVLGVLGYTSIWNATITPFDGEGGNPFAGEYFPPFNYELWGDSVYEIVSHYKDDVHYWEVWDEPDRGSGNPDSGLWRGTPQEYTQLLATAYNAIKRADPNAKVLLGSLSNSKSNPTFLHDILADETYPAANYFDIIGIHFNGLPEALPERISEITTTLTATNTGDHPIWITEITYPSHSYNFQQGIDQERYFCNIVTTDMIANPNVEKFFIFDRSYSYIAPENCNIYE